MTMTQKLATVIYIGLVLLCLGHGSLDAEVTFDWATVGNPGNAGDVQPQGVFGAVAYTYRISKHEVTVAQYTEFLNAVAATDTFPGPDEELWLSAMTITRSGSSGSYTYTAFPGFEQRPATWITFFDAMRFANWLHNGQGSGGTESGVYTISDGYSETRSASATFFLPSEDEWYKAAYHQPAAQGGPADDYWLYPTQSDATPACVVPPGVGNSANCDGAVGGATDVAAYTNTGNFYGTYDQGGNQHEWNEAIVQTFFRGVRGGSKVNIPLALAASSRNNSSPLPEFEGHWGIRIASIPEPSSGLLGAFGLIGLLMRRRR